MRLDQAHRLLDGTLLVRAHDEPEEARVDGRAIDTRFLGFVVSPHEECAVEEAVRLIEAHGGESVVMTLGPAEAADQLRDAMAIGIDRAVLLQTDGSDWDPMATAAAL